MYNTFITIYINNFKIGLTIVDLVNVKIKLNNAKFDNTEWKALGLALGLQIGTLNVIEKDHPNNTNGCHDECLSKWLQRADDVDKCHGVPTYSSLADALDKINLKDVADKIRK